MRENRPDLKKEDGATKKQKSQIIYLPENFLLSLIFRFLQDDQKPTNIQTDFIFSFLFLFFLSFLLRKRKGKRYHDHDLEEKS